MDKPRKSNIAIGQVVEAGLVRWVYIIADGPVLDQAKIDLAEFGNIAVTETGFRLSVDWRFVFDEVVAWVKQYVDQVNAP